MKHIISVLTALFLLAGCCGETGPAENYSLEISGTASQRYTEWCSDFSIIVENYSYKEFKEARSFSIYEQTGANMLKRLDRYVEDFMVRILGREAPYNITIDGYVQDKKGIIYRVHRQYLFDEEQVRPVSQFLRTQTDFPDVGTKQVTI